MRLVGLRHTPGDYRGRTHADAYAGALLAQGDWREFVKCRGFRLLVAGENTTGIVLPNESGLIVGTLFRRDGDAHTRVEEASSALATQWCATGGRDLVETYWGDYLAILCDHSRDEVRIIRDPLGARPCFLFEKAEVDIFFTDARDLAAMGTLALNDRYVSLFLKRPRLQTSRTGLNDVTEILPGEAIVLGRERTTREIVWAPGRVSPRPGLVFDQGAPALRAALDSCIAAWSGTAPHILHRLSGGFDSSVVLSALCRSGHGDILCMHEWAKGAAEADERAEAISIAAHFGVRLEIVAFDIGAIDYSRLLSLPASPKPHLADLSFANAVAIPCIEGEVLATSGQGGDQIFARRPSLDSAGDAIRDGLPLSEIWRILEDNARTSGKPLTRILKETWRGLTMRQAQYLVQAWGDAVDAGDEVNGAMIQHPWLRDTLCGPSRAQRILNLVDLPYYHAPNVLSARYPTVPVIASQPIVETALSIAPYVMQQGGGDRALARAAFADVLPKAQLQRTRKGDATRYFAAVVDANLNFMRDILCDGELVRRRLVDSEVIAADLARPLQGGAIYRLTDAMVAEIWIRRVETLRNAEAKG